MKIKRAIAIIFSVRAAMLGLGCGRTLGVGDDCLADDGACSDLDKHCAEGLYCDHPNGGGDYNPNGTCQACATPDCAQYASGSGGGGYVSGGGGGGGGGGGDADSSSCAISLSSCGPSLVDTEIQCEVGSSPPDGYDCSVVANDSEGVTYCCNPLATCDATDCDASIDDAADDAVADANDE